MLVRRFNPFTVPHILLNLLLCLNRHFQTNYVFIGIRNYVHRIRLISDTQMMLDDANNIPSINATKFMITTVTILSLKRYSKLWPLASITIFLHSRRSLAIA